MPLEGKRINELTEVSKVDTSSKLVIDTGGAEALSITLKNLIDSSGVGSVDIATTEKAGIIKVGNNLTITEDGTLNVNTDTLATKKELDGYLPLSGGTINGALNVVGPKSTIKTYSGDKTSGFTYLELKSADTNQALVILANIDGETRFRQRGKTTEISNLVYNKSLIISSTLTFDNNKVLDASDKAVANGVASLDANGKVPSEQIPVATASTLGGVKLEFDETTGTLNIKTE